MLSNYFMQLFVIFNLRNSLISVPIFTYVWPFPYKIALLINSERYFVHLVNFCDRIGSLKWL